MSTTTVRGHWRKDPKTGKPVWVQEHQRQVKGSGGAGRHDSAYRDRLRGWAANMRRKVADSLPSDWKVQAIGPTDKWFTANDVIDAIEEGKFFVDDKSWASGKQLFVKVGDRHYVKLTWPDWHKDKPYFSELFRNQIFEVPADLVIGHSNSAIEQDFYNRSKVWERNYWETTSTPEEMRDGLPPYSFHRRKRF